jgi:predicted HNH restriction endonuclease
MYLLGAGKRAAKPKAKVVASRKFERNPVVVAIARVRAGIRCEVPGCHHPTFLDEYGSAYCEVHHIEPLEAGGPDTPENVACICPAHHREAHLGKAAERIGSALLAVRRLDAP